MSKAKVEKHSTATPTLNYFLLSLKGESNLLDAHKAAIEYIQAQYPKATKGSNHWSTQTKAPIVDQYFLRLLTFRGCVPPYKDSGIDDFKDQVMQAVKQQLMEFDESTEFSPQIK